MPAAIRPCGSSPWRAAYRARFRFILPDVWDNVEAAAAVHRPLLWIHSRADATIPLSLGQPVYAAYAGEKSALTLDAFDHNAIYQDLPPQIWSPILFLRQQRPTVVFVKSR